MNKRRHVRMKGIWHRAVSSVSEEHHTPKLKHEGARKGMYVFDLLIHSVSLINASYWLRSSPRFNGGWYSAAPAARICRGSKSRKHLYSWGGIDFLVGKTGSWSEMVMDCLGRSTWCLNAKVCPEFAHSIVILNFEMSSKIVYNFSRIDRLAVKY